MVSSASSSSISLKSSSSHSYVLQHWPSALGSVTQFLSGGGSGQSRMAQAI